jgi:hypothetical protein
MAALALGNNRTLHQLHQELDLLEQHQLRDPDSVRKPTPMRSVPAVEPSAAATSEAEAPSPVDPATEPGTQP